MNVLECSEIRLIPILLSSLYITWAANTFSLRSLKHEMHVGEICISVNMHLVWYLCGKLRMELLECFYNRINNTVIIVVNAEISQKMHIFNFSVTNVHTFKNI